MEKIFILFVALIFMFKKFLFTSFLLIIPACGSNPPSKSRLDNFQPAPVTDPFQINWQTLKDGIHSVIIADKELNNSNINGANYALAINVCVMQLSDPTLFNTNIAIDGGIDKALNCNLDKDDKSGFGALAAKSLYIQPNTLTDIKMDRVQNARYLAVVAGYNHLNVEKSTAIFEYPIKTSQKGLIFKENVYSATPIDLQISLSADRVSVDGVERIIPEQE